MNSLIIIVGTSIFILLLLVVGLPGKALRWLGQSVMKLMIGALLLFLLNAVGNQFGIHVPINFVTSAVSGFLGLPGVAALTIIQFWVLV